MCVSDNVQLEISRHPFVQNTSLCYRNLVHTCNKCVASCISWTNVLLAVYHGYEVSNATHLHMKCASIRVCIRQLICLMLRVC